MNLRFFRGYGCSKPDWAFGLKYYRVNNFVALSPPSKPLFIFSPVKFKAVINHYVVLELFRLDFRVCWCQIIT